MFKNLVSSISISLLKYEERSIGNERHLIVKNIQPADAGIYYACAQGVCKSAKLQTVSDVKEMVYSNYRPYRTQTVPLNP